jgi:hypothetical protein
MLTVKEMIYKGYQNREVSYYYDVAIGSFTYDRPNGCLTVGGRDGANVELCLRYHVSPEKSDKLVEVMREISRDDSLIAEFSDIIIDKIIVEGTKALNYCYR